MLPSPPLTAENCSPSPHSLKRTLSDATDDACTPPLSQPLKRARYATSLDLDSQPDDDEQWHFDPSRLLTPPEYTHTPYDPEFGAKVSRQYKRSMRTKRVCDAATAASRRQKYGEEDALSYSPGSTPDHVRQRYHQKQRELDELAAEIIANSETESEAEGGSDDSGYWSQRRKMLKKGRKPGLEVREKKIISSCSTGLTSSRDAVSALHSSTHPSRTAIKHAVPLLSRTDDYDDLTSEHNGKPLGAEHVRFQTGRAFGHFKLGQDQGHDFLQLVSS